MMSRCKRKKDCIYAMQDECNPDRHVCGYILIMHEPRGCPPERCDKFKPKDRSSEEQEQTKTGEKTEQATEHTEAKAVQPVGVQVFQHDRGVQR